MAGKLKESSHLRKNRKQKPSININKKKRGALIIVGGGEDKTGELTILREIAKRTKGGKLVVATVASTISEEQWTTYKKVFHCCGVKKIVHLQIEQPEEAKNPKLLSLFDGAKTVFFTGGDQLKITTKIGGTLIIDKMLEILNNGGNIAGTSAGAAIMGKTMLVGGENEESHKVGNWMMAPGLGFVDDMIIDQHFAQRGRISRLLGAVALNPGILGIGIDEDTAVIIEGEKFKVIGSNAVYVIDGREVTYTNISQAAAERTMSMHDVRLHVLAADESFDFVNRKVSIPPRDLSH